MNEMINGINGRPMAVNGRSGPVNGNGLLPEVRDGRVDARSVHEALEVATPFHKWFSRRVEEIGLEEGRDYFCWTDLSSKTSGSGGHNREDYLLTIDAAKELAIVERTEVGKRMRRYFIDCEKNLTAVTSGQISAPEAAERHARSQAQAGLPVSIARKLADHGAAVALELANQEERITALERHMRPGPDWMTAREYAERHPEIEWSDARKARLSYLAAHQSAKLGYPVGSRARAHGRDVKSFSPAALDAALRSRALTWKKPARQTGEALPLPMNRTISPYRA